MDTQSSSWFRGRAVSGEFIRSPVDAQSVRLGSSSVAQRQFGRR